MAPSKNEVTAVPHEPYPRLFMRYLKFGLLAWGGPVAQIAMIRQEIVENERWISRERFNRVLGVYQALPGPEAHELCVYFGMLSRGRWGAFLAGLGFMLPGFLLMFTLSWMYVTYGIHSILFAALFYGFKPAVAALVLRAGYGIGRRAVTNRWLLGIALASGAAALLGSNELLLLVLVGLVYFLLQGQRTVVERRRPIIIFLIIVTALLGAILALWSLTTSGTPGGGTEASPNSSTPPPSLLLSGFKAGMLTFGGAYTVIPFLQGDATGPGGWMTRGQFLDGLALSGILPAPLIIFSTFVGYLGGGPLGALLMTIGIFLPAFGFTIVGHDFFERVVENPVARIVLDGVSAGVVGLIAATSIILSAAALAPEGALDLLALAIFLVALLVLHFWKAKVSVVGAVLAGGALGLLRFLVFPP